MQVSVRDSELVSCNLDYVLAKQQLMTGENKIETKGDTCRREVAQMTPKIQTYYMQGWTVTKHIYLSICTVQILYFQHIKICKYVITDTFLKDYFYVLVVAAVYNAMVGHMK